MTPQTPERCGQQYGADGRANAPLYVCTLAAGHHGGCHMDIENNATWSGAGDATGKGSPLTPQTPERCGQRHVTYRERAGLPNVVHVCTLADQHSGEFHRSDDGSTWSYAGNLQDPPIPVPADGACGASLVFSKTGRAYSCGLPTGHANTSHYDGKENARWSAVDGVVCGERRAFIDADDTTCKLPRGHAGQHVDIDYGSTWPTASERVYLSPSTLARVAELESLAAPSETGALNLGPIIERQRVDWSKASPSAAYVSAADVLPLVREVMRLRRPTPAMPGDAVQRSALAGIARHIEDMRHVFAELLAATCTGCPIVANSSNPEDGADLEPVDGCPVHGEVAELRRQVEWAAQQSDRIATALGPEYLAPFGPDVTTEVLRLIELGRQYEGLQR